MDLNDKVLAERILGADKHQLVEGLAVECVFDQILAAVPGRATAALTPLDVETVMVDTQRLSERWLVFVWARSMSAGLGRYLAALENCAVPFLLELRDGQFWVTRTSHGKRASVPEPLQTLMQRLSRRTFTPFRVAASVRNEDRQREAFWGTLFGHYRQRLGMEIVLPRLLINCGIQPYFRFLWNLDRVFVGEDSMWMLEVKHKFPIPSRELAFGINDGELNVFSMLAEAGIRCVHAILVKPFWDKNAPSGDLFNNLSTRTRVALVGLLLDSPALQQIQKSKGGRSGSHTSITGSSTLGYKTIPAAAFSRLGLLSDAPDYLAERIIGLISGRPVPRASDAWLRSLRTGP